MSTTTFDYIPRIILGKSNSYIYNSINLVIRAIAFYIYFKTTEKLDILQLILAYVFPIIYIFFKISETNTDYIFGLFIPNISNTEKCIERRGAPYGSNKSGNLKSIPDDFKECNSVELNTTESKVECESIVSVGDPDDPDLYPKGTPACLYISKETDGYEYRKFDCGNYNDRAECNSQEDNNNQQLCTWTQTTRGECRDDKIRFGYIETQGREGCPNTCLWDTVTDMSNPKCSDEDAQAGSPTGRRTGKCMER